MVGLFAMVEALQAADVASVGGTESARTGFANVAAGFPASPATSAGSSYGPVSWVPAEPRVPERTLPTVVPPLRAMRPSATVARPVGRLVEAPIVAPGLRLGSRGDARSLREAEEANTVGTPAPALPSRPGQEESSVNDERLGLLEGGTVL